MFFKHMCNCRESPDFPSLFLSFHFQKHPPRGHHLGKYEQKCSIQGYTAFYTYKKISHRKSHEVYISVSTINNLSYHTAFRRSLFLSFHFQKHPPRGHHLGKYEQKCSIQGYTAFYTYKKISHRKSHEVYILVSTINNLSYHTAFHRSND